ncbi:MAG: MFS transporter [Gemmatimonadaceae bacterium]|nr:MFS transporter [Gemmatimonadaceae bacterium]
MTPRDGVTDGGARAGVPAGTPPAAGGRATRVRWRVCALLFAATVINYVDRQTLGILAPVLQRDIGWSEADYGDIVSWFTIAYALGFLGIGRLIDAIGVRRGFAAAITTWSAAAMAHALARTPFGFSVARFGLGLGESGHFPSAIKVVAEWFPQRERALATGIFNAGSNVGAVLTPLLVPPIALAYGWRAAFVVTGALGFLWLAAWWRTYRAPGAHPGVNAAELALITEDAARSGDVGATEAPRAGWRALLVRREAWAFAIGKALTDPVWWFHLYWLPKFLDARHGVTLTALALPLVAVYTMADVGSVGGGWLSSRLIARGMAPLRARLVALLAMALLTVPLLGASGVDSQWGAVALVALAAAAHQGWSANLFTLASDVVPARSLGTLVGLGGFAGALGGVAFQRATGRVLEATGGDYTPLFLTCGLAYVLAWAAVRILLAPRLRAGGTTA